MRWLWVLLVSMPACAQTFNVNVLNAKSIISPSVPSISVSSQGALCNWNGSTGTDDSAAFQSAVTAAGALYASSKYQVSVLVPYGCTLGTGSGQTTINVPSGVRLVGPGSIFVPAQSANPLFLMTSVSDDIFDGITITMVSNLSACSVTANNSLCSAIRWDGASPGTSSTYARLSIRNMVILNSGWGITALAQTGNDLLTDVHIEGNTIAPSANPVTAYQWADAIHVGGNVSAVTIANNIVTGRSDAGIAVTTETSGHACSNVTIAGNMLYEDRIGIDDSGCSNVHVSGNWVHADISTSTSNPAYRSIYYNGLPKDITVVGNTLENYQGSGTDYSAKFDCQGGCGSSGTITAANYFNAKFSGNKLYNFYVRGSQLDFSGNTIESGGGINVDWDTTNGNGSDYLMFGQNTWQGTGTFVNSNRSDVYFGDYIAPQMVAPGGITFSNPGELGSISATYGALTATSLSPGVLYSAAGTALPTCASGIKGQQATVSDATSPTFMGAYTSGGGVTASVLCSYNGTTYAWLTH